MQTIPSVYQESVVRKALEYMRSRTGEETLVPQVAAAVGCSPGHLRRIFRSVTGKGVLAAFQKVRMDRARDLLRRTSLSVTEVAFEVGFENPSSFTRLFHREVGTSPLHYRQAMRESPAAATAAAGALAGEGLAGIMLRDALASGALADWWTVKSGSWRQQEGYLEGGGQVDMDLQLTLPLPGNFRVDFEARIGSGPSGAAGFHVELLDEIVTPYCDIFIGPSEGGQGSLRLRGRTQLWCDGAVVTPGAWHGVGVALNDGETAVFLDGKRVMEHRDIFARIESARLRFGLFSHPNTLHLRHFVLRDLGFPPVVPAVRQGDALFNAGLFTQAMAFYSQHLRKDTPPEEEAELRFKIGMCLYRQGHAGPCRDWIGGMLPAAPPRWRRECTLLLLAMEADADSLDSFVRRASAAWLEPDLRASIRPVVSDYYRRLRDAGFLHRALRLTTLMASLEKDSPATMVQVTQRRAKVLKHLNRFEDAERILRRLSLPPYAGTVRADSLISLSDVSLARGRVEEARRINARVTPLRHETSWSELQEARCLRTERRFEEAVERCLECAARYPEADLRRLLAESEAAKMLACMGRIDEARRIVARSRRRGADARLSEAIAGRGGAFVVELVRNRHARLAARLMRTARQDGPNVAERARNMVIAGFLSGLAGRDAQAVEIWREAARRFPPEQCCFWGALARELAAGQPVHFNSVPFRYGTRSELFYLAGLWCERRGNAARARRLFARAVHEDPTLDWAAHLAAQRGSGGA
jgi:AraC-like DNA-binding protein/tetratricopeptide (TPR) repeat protein